MPTEQKAFRDELRSNYWGVDLDGETGLPRGSLKRAVPLVALILRVVRLQRATADLLRLSVARWSLCISSGGGSLLRWTTSSPLSVVEIHGPLLRLIVVSLLHC